MSQVRSAGSRLFPTRSAVPSRLDWSDDKLAQLSAEQLRNLLENLDQQTAMGRVSDASASDLRERIAARLPKERRKARPSRARELAELDERVARNLRDLVEHVVQRYALPPAGAIAVADGQTAEAAGARNKAARAAAKMLAGIDRSITYRTGASLAAVVFHLRPEQPHEAGRYVLVATGDLLEGGEALSAFVPADAPHGWSVEEQASLRAAPAPNFAEAYRWFDATIGRIAGQAVGVAPRG